MTDHPLVEAWHARADAKELAAKGYNSKCTTRKGMYCILEARVYRELATQLADYEAKRKAVDALG